MSGKLISDLNSVGTLGLADQMEIDKDVSGVRTSYKTSVKDIVDFANQNFAEEYDSTSSYAVGDYCIYESVLYKCIGTTTGTFDSTKWTSVVVTDEMGQGGGTGGHTIIDENGNSMTARAGLQFVGANVDDDATNNKTIVDVASAGGIDGVFIDTDNLISSGTLSNSGTTSYTATEDCYFVGYSSSGSALAYLIDNVTMIFAPTNQTHSLLLKKGQTLTVGEASTYSISYKIYGIQTGTTHSKFQPVIYSTEEREIGVWTDGKPLYEKTSDCGALPNNTTKTVSHGISNFGHMVGYSGVAFMPNINDIPIPFVHNASLGDNVCFFIDSSEITLRTSSDKSGYTASYITLRYTKTTDVAGSGSWTPQGVPTHHYSTDEHIVGTWNGETLYERMFEVSHTFTQGDNDIELQSNVDFVSSDIKTYDASTVLSNGSASKRVSALANDTLYVNGSNKLIMYFSCTNASVGTRTVRVVAQYTKSS